MQTCCDSDDPLLSDVADVVAESALVIALLPTCRHEHPVVLSRCRGRDESDRRSLRPRTPTSRRLKQSGGLLPTGLLQSTMWFQSTEAKVCV